MRELDDMPLDELIELATCGMDIDECNEARLRVEETLFGEDVEP